MIWLKFLHLAAISIWSAGLICLPGLYLQRGRVKDKAALHRLHGLARFVYVGAISPAAFLGIASGTALIFLRETWAPWFSAKLYFVGVMATIHVLTGLVVIRLFEAGQVYPAWRFVGVTVLTVLTITLILFLALGKPDIPDLLPAGMKEGGGLRDLLGDLNPFRKS